MLKSRSIFPLLIKYPGVEADIIEKPGSITDLGPTVLELLGIEQRSEGFMGSSLFKEEERPVLFMNELPQILYKGNLFVKDFGEWRGLSPLEELKDLERVGYVKDKEVEIEGLPIDIEEKALDIIYRTREVFLKRRH